MRSSVTECVWLVMDTKWAIKYMSYGSTLRYIMIPKYSCAKCIISCTVNHTRHFHRKCTSAGAQKSMYSREYFKRKASGSKGVYVEVIFYERWWTLARPFDLIFKGKIEFSCFILSILDIGTESSFQSIGSINTTKCLST
jgi:hypothetical protein